MLGVPICHGLCNLPGMYSRQLQRVWTIAWLWRKLLEFGNASLDPD